MDINNFKCLAKYCEKENIQMAMPVQTNEEYIRTCSTEQLAELLCLIAVSDVLYDRIRQPYYTDGKKAVMEWLKEKHHE